MKNVALMLDVIWCWWYNKQEAHGPQHSPVKPGNINKHICSNYDYIITLIWKGEKQSSPFLWLNGPFLQNLESLSPKNALCQVWLKWPIGSAEEDFYISSMYFCYFVIIFSLKRAGSFMWKNLNPLHPRMLCAKFDWN